MLLKIVLKLSLVLSLGVSGLSTAAQAENIQATCISARGGKVTAELVVGDYPEGTSAVTMTLHMGDSMEPEIMSAYGQYFVKEVLLGVNASTAEIKFSLTGAELSLYQDASGIVGDLFYKGDLVPMKCGIVGTL